MSGTWLPNPTHGTPARGPPSYVPHRMVVVTDNDNRNRSTGGVYRAVSVPSQTLPSSGERRTHVGVPRDSAPYQYPVSVGTIDEDGLDDFDRSLLNGNDDTHPQRSLPTPTQTIRTSHSHNLKQPRQSLRMEGHQRDNDSIHEMEVVRGFGSSQHESAPLLATPSSLSTTPVVQGIPLVSVSGNLPDKFGAVFPFKLFNAVQSKCFDIVYKTDDNVVVAAPTGSGKTAILELAICKLALDRGDENLKIVYQAPTKALCAERARDWEKKFSHMSLKCAELTGDTGPSEMKKVGEASIIITTPEKWDSVTRKWFDHQRLLQMVRLFLIDEVHILKDVRGATLEAVVSRMKTIGANVRFVALSATVPNSEDIATWLGRNHTNQQLPAHRQTFGEEFRPVKLEKFVYGFQSNMNAWQFDKLLDSKLLPLIEKHSQRKPILVFCFTRKSCETTASVLAEYISKQPDKRLWPMPSCAIPMINQELQEMARFGVAFHHANLDLQDRVAVEQNFLKGQLGVICCTSTLAVGVNLPCHTVVLKNTVAFKNDNLEEICDLEVMQMLGRAGRPQFDDSATAIIITRMSNKARYEKMVSGQEILESTLHVNLIEHLNSEVCLGTITNLSSAKAWLAGTFLSVRLRLNPKHYRLTGGVSNPMEIEKRLEEICERDIKLLQETELVTDTDSFKSTVYGRSMSRFMVEFTTMKMLLEIPRAPCMETLITALSQASEFKDFRLRPGEKALFREINESPLIMYPIKESITLTWQKVSLLIQAHLGQIQYGDSNENGKLRRQLLMEKTMIFERLQRLARSVTECKGYDRDAIGIKTALELTRSLSAEAWEGRPTQLTQVPNIGPVGMRKLASKGIRTVHELADKPQDQIERIMSRQPPFGKKMKDQLDLFPRLALDLAVTGHKSQPRNQEEPVLIHISATIRYLNQKGPPNWGGRPPMLTLIAEMDDDVLVFFWRGSLKMFRGQNAFEVKFSVGLRHAEDVLTCHVSCEDIVGTMVSCALEYQLPATIRLPYRPKCFSLQAPPQKKSRARDSPDCIGDDGINDSDLLLAEMATNNLASRAKGDNGASFPTERRDTTINAQPAEQRANWLPTEDHLEVPTQTDEADEQPDTDARLEEAQSGNRDVGSEPVQLPNGKWRCNHLCSGDLRTKSGKPCTHRCCKEGLDKPRKRAPPRPKKRKTEEVGDNGEHVPEFQADPALNPAHGVSDASPPAKRPKQITVAGPKILGGPGPSTSTQDWEQLDNIQCIDLSNVDDETVRFPRSGQDVILIPSSSPSVVHLTTPATDQAPPRQSLVNHHGQFSAINKDISTLPAEALTEATSSSLTAPVTSTPPMESRNDEFPLIQYEYEPSPFKEGGEDPMLFDGISQSMTRNMVFEELPMVKPAPVNEPAWVAEFDDQDLVEYFRGYVTFV